MAYTAFLRPFNFLGILGCLFGCFKKFTFKNYTLIYMGSDNACKAYLRQNRLISKYGE